MEDRCAMKMEENCMELVFCEKYRCRMSAAACAARHLNAVRGGQAPVGRARAGADDPNCAVCADGAARAATLGKKGVDGYRKELAGIKQRAWAAQGHPSVKRKKGVVMEKAEDPGETKVCKKCGEPKLLKEFRANWKSKDGRLNTCAGCMSKLYSEGQKKRKDKPGKGKSKPVEAVIPIDPGPKESVYRPVKDELKSPVGITSGIPDKPKTEGYGISIGELTHEGAIGNICTGIRLISDALVALVKGFDHKTEMRK